AGPRTVAGPHFHVVSVCKRSRVDPDRCRSSPRIRWCPTTAGAARNVMIASIVFWAAALLLGYTYVGYPVLVLVLARVRPRPVMRGSALPAVTAVLTVHNGGADLAAKLENLSSLDYPPGRLDIVVACDGCSDASGEIARAHSGRPVRVLEYAERRGKA